jgi:hypothetical protein
MNCKLFLVLLDDHIDAELDAHTEADMLAHAASCTACATFKKGELELRRSLQAIPVPAPRFGYAERMLAAAGRARPSVPRRHRHGSVSSAVAGAVAATLAIGVTLWVVRGPIRQTAATPAPLGTSIPVAHVRPAATAGVQPVRLVFRSATALQNVTIEIDLPDGVELEGFPGQRRLTWQSDLTAGSNLLELPVRLSGRGGVLTATLNHGTERRRFTVQLVSGSPPAATSAMPAPSYRYDGQSSTIA